VVLVVAALYVFAEQSEDLLPGKPPINLPGIQALLAHRPDVWRAKPKAGEVWLFGIELGVIEEFDIDALTTMLTGRSHITGVPNLESQAALIQNFGLLRWIEQWRVPLENSLAASREEES